MKNAIIAMLPVLLASPALAGICPDAPDHSSALSELIAAVQDAPNEMSARAFSSDMWALWADAPDPYAQDLLDEGMERRRAYDYDGAIVALDALVAYCPDYAEGYNQRAFVNFLRGDFAVALPDLEKAIELSPRHIAAMTGQALTLVGLDRKAEAALALRAALKLNPWLSERSLLPSLEAEEQEL